MENKIPYYNTKTRKIYNCKKYSFLWYHELRHKQQHNKDLFTDFFGWCKYSILISIPLSLISSKFLLIPSLFIVVLWIYVEGDAWIYAFKKFYL